MAELKELLNSQTMKSVNALFALAPFLPPALLRRAIRIVRSVGNYPRREKLLKVLSDYLVRRTIDPASLDREISSPAPKLLGPQPPALQQALAELSPNERNAILRRTLVRIEGYTKPKAKGRGKPKRLARPAKAKTKAAAQKPLRPKPSKGGAKKAALIKKSRRTALRPKPKKGGGGGGGGRFPSSGFGFKSHIPSAPMPRKESSASEVKVISGPKTSQHPSPKKASKQKSTKRVVSTGFALPPQAAKPIKSNTPLKAGEKYYFWLEVGERVIGTIEVKDEELPTEKLPKQAILDVVLFEVEDGLKLVPGQDSGKLRLDEGTVTVESQPARIPSSDVSGDSSLLERRLFFPVIAPKETGNYRLRCNIYYRTVMVQSRIVNAYVMRRPQTKAKALQAKVDYTLSRTLSVNHVSGIRPHLLSVMVNSNGNGTHDFFFFGSQEFKKDRISFNGQELQGLIEQARNAYALAAWGANNPWQNQTYRYDQTRAQNLQQLKDDLIRFAIRGYNIYDKVINRLAGGAQNAEALAELMSKPGMVQIALKESPSFIIPAAIVYDQSIDVDADSSKFTLCSTFLEALEAGPPLEESDCFKGNCPTKEDDTVVCPSGFWGYRHQLGLPLSVAGASDAPTVITWSKKPVMTVGVSTDPLFILREQHLQKLQALRPAGLEWNYGPTRDVVIKKLKETKPQVVYFYCHGGLSATRPYIQVGPPNASGNLSPSFLRVKKIRWENPGPLVFINGCHTTALEPEQAIEFITPFIENANAAGVIGTEITIFEPIATAFGEECLRRFFGKSTIGEAVRCARLKLLKNGNPLGLVYIPYVMASLSLAEQ